MNQPHLTQNIEKKLLSLIKAAEQSSVKEGIKIDSKLYLQLADLYHFHKNYKAERAILQRFTQLENGVADELGDIFERIERLGGLLLHAEEAKPKSIPLALVPDVNDEEKISISSAKQIVPRVHQGRKPFGEQNLKILTLSAAYTGTTDKDEIIQVAMVLIEYTPQRMKKSKLLGSYWGQRKTKIAIPKKVANQFNFNLTEKDVVPFSSEAAMALVAQADLIVSHNDAEIERKLLATLLPPIAEISWYSSERDIPWRAMGFDSNRLTQLARPLDERAPRTCMDRAMIISRILQKTEPFSTQTYLERIYNMQPMKAFHWTAQLQKQRARMSKPESAKKRWIAVAVLLVFVASVVGYLMYAGIL